MGVLIFWFSMDLFYFLLGILGLAVDFPSFLRDSRVVSIVSSFFWGGKRRFWRSGVYFFVFYGTFLFC